MKSQLGRKGGPTSSLVPFCASKCKSACFDKKQEWKIHIRGVSSVYLLVYLLLKIYEKIHEKIHCHPCFNIHWITMTGASALT